MLGALDAHVDRIVVTVSSEELVDSAGAASPYAASKLAQRPYVDLFRREYRLDIVVARPFMAYGPGQPRHRLVPQTVLALLSGESPEVRDPERVCDFVYGPDVAHGLIVAALARDLSTAPLDLGTGVGTRIRDVCETIRTLVPDAPAILYAKSPPSVGPHLAFATGARLLGWRAETPLLGGLAETVQWYRARCLEDADKGADP